MQVNTKKFNNLFKKSFHLVLGELVCCLHLCVYMYVYVCVCVFIVYV